MPSASTYPLAPLGRRACAWLLDMTLGAGVAFAVVDVLGGRHDLAAVWQLVAFKSVNGKAGHQLSSAMSPAGMNPATIKPVLGLLAILMVVALAGVAYRVATTALWGAGIGKWLLGLRVIVDTHHAPRGEAGVSALEAPAREAPALEAPGWRRAWKRWAVPQAPGLIPLPATSMLAYLPAAKDHRRRGLHDRAAGTIVVDVRNAPVEPVGGGVDEAHEPWRLSSQDGYHVPVPVRVLTPQ